MGFQLKSGAVVTLAPSLQQRPPIPRGSGEGGRVGLGGKGSLSPWIVALTLTTPPETLVSAVRGNIIQERVCVSLRAFVSSDDLYTDRGTNVTPGPFPP